MKVHKTWLKYHRISEDGIIERICSTCNNWMIENNDNFYLKNKSYPEKGYMSECKECTIQRNSKWIHDNPERYKEINHRRLHKPEVKIERRRQSKERRLAGKQKEWQIKNPEKVRGYSSLHRSHNITATEWERCKKYFDYACAYCGLHISIHYYTRNGVTKQGDLHKDHVDHEGSNGLSNCVPACKSCNCKKWQFMLDDWYNQNNEVYDADRYNKIIKWIDEDCKKCID